MGSSSSPEAGRARWATHLSTGFEIFTNTYALAEDDTTETIAEAALTAGMTGNSGRGSRNRWRVAAEASAGTDLWRERLEADWRLRDAGRNTRLRATASAHARQFRRETDYGLNSDSRDGRLDLRGYPLAGDGRALEMRSWLSGRSYSVPSTLELDQREWGGGAALHGGTPLRTNWSVGGRYARRTYPDSTGLDRSTWSLDASWEGPRIRVYHRTDRRRVRDETARPSAWSHWTDLDLELEAGAGAFFLELENEYWDYDEERAAYQDYLRTSLRTGYRWGDVLGVRWRAGLSGGFMDSDDEQESYTQYGVLGGVESYGYALTGSVLVETGWRDYRGVVVDPALRDPDGQTDVDLLTAYTDFQYWKIWVMATWSVADNLDLAVLASYEPERHGEKTDDTTLGYASVQLVWRP